MDVFCVTGHGGGLQELVAVGASLFGSGRDMEEACPDDLRILAEVEAVVELAERELDEKELAQSEACFIIRLVIPIS